MRTTAASILCGALLALGCGHHDAADPTSVPIPAITYDAVFVVNGEDGTISVINAETDELAGTIELQNVDYPHHVYLSADRATMLVAVPGVDLSGGHAGGHHGHLRHGHDEHASGGAVLVLDATTGSTRRARRLDAANHNAIFAPGGAAIWTTQAGQPGQALLLDPVTLATLMTVDVGNDPSEVTFSTDGAHAFVANTGSNSVSVLDPVSGAVTRAIPVGATPVGAWPGSDGRMYVDNETDKSLTVIDATSLEVVMTIALGFTPAVAATAPGGELWVTDTDGGKLVFYRASDGTKLGDLATGAGAHAIAFSADGSKAYVTNQVAGTVTVVDVATKSVSKTVQVGAKPNGITFRTE